VIAGGGKLIELAQERALTYVKIARLSQPRYGVIMHLRAISRILAEFKVAEGAYDEIATTRPEISPFIDGLLPEVETLNNPAKQLAIEVVGRSPVIYASSLFAPLAYKWKISFNENAKNVAWWDALPEFNHNEFIGWSSHPIEKPYAVIDLRSNFNNPRIQKRFEVSDRLLSGRRPAARTVNLTGETILAQLISGSIMADFVSIYLAILNNVNPTPVDLVEQLKRELG
jgi:glucose/mannose-6-phosphate isomerase